MSYFVMENVVAAGQTFSTLKAAVDASGNVAEFGSLVEAEEAMTVQGLADYRVFDYSKFEVPVPLIAPGTPMLVDGQWVVSA